LNSGRWREAALFAALGTLPDIDLLFGAHSGPTHSIGAAVMVGVLVTRLGAGGLLRSPLVPPWAAMLACSAAYGSHVLLDWMSTDSSAPIGIMALWPFDRGYYESDLHVFGAISRRYYQGWTFVRQNGVAVLRELAILIPTLIVVVVLRRRLERE
jgi:inner membrane protein